MSIDSALIVRRERLPGAAELAAAIAEAGVSVTFPDGFRLDEWQGGWLPVTVDGELSGFEYYPGPPEPEEELPPSALQYGDYLLRFAAGSGLSAETASLMHRALARWGAAGWIDGQVIEPAELAEDVDVETLDPELRALVQGTPAERAAAMEAYVDRHAAATPPRRTGLSDGLRPLIIPAIIVLVFAAIFLWIQLT